MELKRFFANKSNYSGDTIIIDGEEFLHMTKVLRHKVGYKIIVNLDDGMDYYCHITKLDKNYATAQVDSIEQNPCHTIASLTLFQALPKGDKLDLIIQKSVELGVDKIVPFLSQYTNETKYNQARQERIALEACKQCGRGIKAQVGDLIEFDRLIEELKEYDTIILPYEHATVGSMGDIKGLEQGKKIALIIGSEGGFAPYEVEAIENIGGQVLSLGKRILRCETASIISVGLVMYELGELKA